MNWPIEPFTPVYSTPNTHSRAPASILQRSPPQMLILQFWVSHWSLSRYMLCICAPKLLLKPRPRAGCIVSPDLWWRWHRALIRCPYPQPHIKYSWQIRKTTNKVTIGLSLLLNISEIFAGGPHSWWTFPDIFSRLCLLIYLKIHCHFRNLFYQCCCVVFALWSVGS